MNILQHPDFLRDYAKLKLVKLNPRRHSAANAYDHCEQVAESVSQLARLNGCTEEQSHCLLALARVHDIGKICGSSHVEYSLQQLAAYGCDDPLLLGLVKYHDINLPWYLAAEKGQPPTTKAWRKMARAVPAKLLCLFMVADRVDSPGGWQNNQALSWFLQAAEQTNFLEQPLIYR